MKNKLLGLLWLFLLAVPVFGQTSGSLPFTAVTPPPPPTLTSLGGLSTSGKIYTGSVMQINGTNFNSACAVNVDGVAQAASTYSFQSATLINFTVPTSLGSSAGTAHTLTVSCTAPALTLNNINTLPNATAGQLYSADLNKVLGVTGGVPPYSWSLTSGSLPTGLTLSASGVVSGMPSGAGSASFAVTVKDSTGLTIKRFTFDSKNLRNSLTTKFSSTGD
jgi:hypothetical protein